MFETLATVPDTTLPVLPLKSAVIFPHMAMPLFFNKDHGFSWLKLENIENRFVILASKRHESKKIVDVSDLCDVATLVVVTRAISLADGTCKLLVEGQARIRLIELETREGDVFAHYGQLSEIVTDNQELTALARITADRFRQYSDRSGKVPSELLNLAESLVNPSRLADLIAVHLPIGMLDKQKLLDELNVNKRLVAVLTALDQEIQIQEVEHTVRQHVKRQVAKNHKEYFLQEQLKAVQKELAALDENYDEIGALAKQLAALKLPQEAQQKAEVELKKLKSLSSLSAEAAIIQNYLEWFLKLPWSKRSPLKRSISAAEAVLSESHFGLQKEKDRVLEHLAVQIRCAPKALGSTLCLVGPPGTGKTSLAKAIAKATGRAFAQIALGGVRDEAELRGHRRTYVGAMPGKILQALAKVKMKNPVILLDELDKISGEHRGDPAAALLEILDPEQHDHFQDNYLQLGFDLKEVMFIATANTLDFPLALRDRLEIIRVSGYTDVEKLRIAQQYIIPKCYKTLAVRNNELAFESSALLSIIQNYTQEAGVRKLAQHISTICRKVVKKNGAHVRKPVVSTLITSQFLPQYLGTAPFQQMYASEEQRVGVVNGLAWTPCGGELLSIEATAVPGTGKLIQTGTLGKVMCESIQAALTVVRARASKLGVGADFLSHQDLHLHVPEGATPKDGPSAGIAICTALTSALTGIPVRQDLAMTGEITLQGKVLKIGGLKEKLLAAKRSRLRKVIIPYDNLAELEEIPQELLENLNVVPVKTIQMALNSAIETNFAFCGQSSASFASSGSVPAAERDAQLEKTVDPQKPPVLADVL